MYWDYNEARWVRYPEAPEIPDQRTAVETEPEADVPSR